MNGMKTTLSLVSAGIFLFLSGCASKDKKVPEYYKSVSPEVAGTGVPSGSLETVRKGENIRVYHVGRRIDPSNPKIMHEAGTMYVIADSGKWNLSPNYPPLDSRHNRSITISAPLTAEKLLELRELKNTNGVMMKLGETLIDARERLREAEKRNADAAKKYSETEAELRKRIAELEAKNLAVLKKLTELQLNHGERRTRP